MTESENFYSEAEMQELLADYEASIADRERLQDENEILQEKITKLEQTAQYLTEQIENLSESDLQLKRVQQEKENLQRKQNELQREAEILTDRAYKAEAAEQRARKALQEAREKDTNAEKHITRRVSKAKAEIERESAQKLSEATKRVRVLNSSIVPALALYGVIMTLIWAAERKEVIGTLPQWFFNRWNDIQTVAAAIKSAFLAVRDWTPATWDPVARYLPSVLLSAGIIVGLFFALRAAGKRFVTWYKGVWDNYRDKAEKRLKWAYTVVICLVSFLLAVLLAQHTPVLWFSWFLLFAVAGTLLYHAACSNHTDW